MSNTAEAQSQEPTIKDLLTRIDELENKLVPPPKPDMNQLLRDMVSQKTDGKRMTVNLDVRTLDKKEARNG